MRRFISVLLISLFVSTAPAVALTPVPVANIPSQVPLPPGPPTPAKPKPGRLTVATVISFARVRQLGIRIQLKLPRGSDTVQITIRQRNRIVVRTYRVNPPRAFRVAETKRLRRGRYTLEVRVGPSRTHLGPASRVTITVR